MATVNVEAVNDAPVSAHQTVTTAEDTTAVITLVATDIDSAVLTTTLVNNPTHGVLTPNADGTYIYTPSANFFGTDSFSYVVNDGELNSHIATVTLDVSAVNDAPIAVNDTLTTAEDSTLVIQVQATDIDSTTLTTVLVAGATHGQVILNADGSFSYTPTANFNGSDSDSFSYKVNDGELDSAIATVNITVMAVNDAPIAVDDTINLNEDNSVNFNPLFNDSDVDGDNLIFRVLSQPSKGHIVVNSDKTVTYTPNANYSGTDSFSYQLNDGQANSNVATVRLIVAAEPNKPLILLSDVKNTLHEIIRTDWKSVSNNNHHSTIVSQATLEQWSLVTIDNPYKGEDGFKVWANGDQLLDLNGTIHTLLDSNNWLELNAGRGIERSVQTIKGATYLLDFDSAAFFGSYANVSIYIDGVKIGSAESSSAATHLSIQQKQYLFVGTGGLQQIRIISELSPPHVNGQIMLLSNISLKEMLSTNTGFQDTAIRISAITPRLTDTDGSEKLSLAISALPKGSILSDGKHSMTVSADNTTIDITDWYLTTLRITPPKGFMGDIDLQVIATATERSNGRTASTYALVKVHVVSRGNNYVTSPTLLTTPSQVKVNSHTVNQSTIAFMSTRSSNAEMPKTNTSVAVLEVSSTQTQHYTAPAFTPLTDKANITNTANTSVAAAINTEASPIVEKPDMSKNISFDVEEPSQYNPSPLHVNWFAEISPNILLMRPYESVLQNAVIERKKEKLSLAELTGLIVRNPK